MVSTRLATMTDRPTNGTNWSSPLWPHGPDMRHATCVGSAAVSPDGEGVSFVKEALVGGVHPSETETIHVWYYGNREGHPLIPSIDRKYEFVRLVNLPTAKHTEKCVPVLLFYRERERTGATLSLLIESGEDAAETLGVINGYVRPMEPSPVSGTGMAGSIHPTSKLVSQFRGTIQSNLLADTEESESDQDSDGRVRIGDLPATKKILPEEAANAPLSSPEVLRQIHGSQSQTNPLSVPGEAGEAQSLNRQHSGYSSAFESDTSAISRRGSLQHPSSASPLQTHGVNGFPPSLACWITVSTQRKVDKQTSKKNTHGFVDRQKDKDCRIRHHRRIRSRCRNVLRTERSVWAFFLLWLSCMIRTIWSSRMFEKSTTYRVFEGTCTARVYRSKTIPCTCNQNKMLGIRISDRDKNVSVFEDQNGLFFC